MPSRATASTDATMSEFPAPEATGPPALQTSAHAELVGVGLVLLAAAGFGSMPILVKVVYDQGGGFVTVLSVRYLAAATITIAAMVLTGRSLRPPSGAHRSWAVMCAFNAAAASCFWAALRLDAVARVAPITYVFPVFVALLAAVVFGERLSLQTIAAIALGIVGCALVIGDGISRPNSVLAGMLALGAAVGTAVFYTAAGRAVGGEDWLSASAALFVTGSVVVAPLVAVVGWQAPSAAGWLALAAVVVTGTVVPFWFFLAGLARLGPVQTSILGTAEPIITVLLAVGLLGETLGTLQAAGIVLILASFLLARIARARTLRRAQLLLPE